MTDTHRDAGRATERAVRIPASTSLPTGSPGALDVVARHEAAALAALEAATGGAPLCRVDGTRQTVKDCEGAAAAISDVRRGLRLLGPGEAADTSASRVQSVIDDVRGRWTSITGALAARPGSQEYVAGGLEALNALEVDLQHPAPERSTVPSSGPGVAAALSASPVLGQLDVSPRGRTAASTTRWSRRRRVVAAGILAGLVLLVWLTAGWPLADAPGWTVLTAGTVVLSSLALALFVPQSGAGWRPDVGCAPCAVAGLAMAVAGPWLAIETAPQVERAALALVIAGAGLARKLTEPPVCPKR